MKQHLTFIHICMSFLFFFLFLSSNGAINRTITVVNNCGFTVWPVISGDPPPYYRTGFELISGSSVSFQTPYPWSGSLWGRTGCPFNGSTSSGWCMTGNCGSGIMECDEIPATPLPPVTVAKFKFNDYKYGEGYDVSLRKGYNLQMTVEPTGGSADSKHKCKKIGCVHDLNMKCPEELMLKDIVGCMPNANYSRLFSSVCQRSSVIGLDDGANSSCSGANYTVRFCPPNNAFSQFKVGSQLSKYDQLVSDNGNFTLGLFGKDNSYMGIWYTGDLEFQKVWVANPNNPILHTSNSIALSIDQTTGDLILNKEGKTLISDIQVGPNVTASLEDTGNFCLINQTNNQVLWQSFDHPSNVLLPGMKLGYDNKTGHNWTLTSWLSDNISDSGAFTLSWEPDIDETCHELVIRRRGQLYWSSGIIDTKTFQNTLLYEDMKSKYILTSEYTGGEHSFSYESDPNYKGTVEPYPMWILTPKGQLTNYNISKTWTPEFCYGYNSNNGCSALIVLPQGRREGDSFSQSKGEFDPQKTKRSVDGNSNISISDCFVRCWNNCSCVGFDSSNNDGTGCVIWTGSNSFGDKGPNSTMKYVISSQFPNNPSPSNIPNNPSPSNKTIKNMKQFWALLFVPLFLGLGLSWFMKMRKQKRKEHKRMKRDEYFLELARSESFKDVHQLESDSHYGDLLLFSFASIMAATCDFSVEYKLGQGGFGPVYKGTLDDGREIAIKRLSRSSGQGLVEFKNELVLIAKLQHTNLVRIFGCCIYGEEKMLVYEYMPNKSLDFFLFDEKKKVELDWPKRCNIIEGIAQGLLYLHKYSRMRVIHRDLKCNNILLDESMNPKISDFGMARIFNQNETQATTNRVVGTYGYMSPEYAMEGTFSVKSDIYSFGVLILEILSGRRNNNFVYLDRTFNLLGYAWELWQQGNAMDLEDPAIGSTCVEQQFLRTMHVALLCVQESAMDRPTTSDMISMLLNDNISLPPPKKPAFFTHRAEPNSSLDQIKPNDCSEIDTTNSAMEGR